MTEDCEANDLILKDLAPIKETLIFCCDFRQPSSIMESEIVFYRCHEIVQTGVRSICLLNCRTSVGSEEPLEEAIRLATYYSNNDPTLFAYSSIFESLSIDTKTIRRNPTVQEPKGKQNKSIQKDTIK